jgi:hypothetical protein
LLGSGGVNSVVCAEEIAKKPAGLSVFGTAIEESSVELAFGIVLPLDLGLAVGSVGSTGASDTTIAGGDCRSNEEVR